MEHQVVPAKVEKENNGWRKLLGRSTTETLERALSRFFWLFTVNLLDWPGGRDIALFKLKIAFVKTPSFAEHWSSCWKRDPPILWTGLPLFSSINRGRFTPTFDQLQKTRSSAFLCDGLTIQRRLSQCNTLQVGISNAGPLSLIVGLKIYIGKRVKFFRSYFIAVAAPTSAIHCKWEYQLLPLSLIEGLKIAQIYIGKIVQFFRSYFYCCGGTNKWNGQTLQCIEANICWQ